MATRAVGSSTTQRILDRMTPGCLLPLSNDSSIKRTTELFQQSVLNGSLNWESWFTFRNGTPYRAQIEGKREVDPWSNNPIHVESSKPEVKFLETQFSEGTVPLTEFEEIIEERRRTFALPIDFSKFAYGNLQWNRKGELELRLRCERRRGFEFVNDLAEPNCIEDSIIRMALKDGTEECSYRRILKDPKAIIKVTTQVGDGDEVKTIVLLAEGQ